MAVIPVSKAAIDLAGIVEHVTVLEFSDTLRADAVLVKKAESLQEREYHQNGHDHLKCWAMANVGGGH